jgi:hypothetical protein
MRGAKAKSLISLGLGRLGRFSLSAVYGNEGSPSFSFSRTSIRGDLPNLPRPNEINDLAFCGFRDSPRFRALHLLWKGSSPGIGVSGRFLSLPAWTKGVPNKRLLTLVSGRPHLISRRKPLA